MDKTERTAGLSVRLFLYLRTIAGHFLKTAKHLSQHSSETFIKQPNIFLNPLSTY